jgi:ubiquinone biosynthesis accessory factor UbiJ
MSKTITMAALMSAERIINLALRYDTATRLELNKLQGKVIAIKITQPEINFFVIPGIEQLRLLNQHEGSIDLSISGSLISLVNLSIKSRDGDTFNLKNAEVKVNGDLGLLADVYSLLKNVDIDWEEILCEFMGDIAGHTTAKFIRTQIDWTQHRATSAKRLFSEFITEEIQLIPTKPELDRFYQQVDELRMAVDRATARVEVLTR